MADPFIFQVIRLVLLILSFALLVEFSRKSLNNLLNLKYNIGVWIYAPILGLAPLGWLHSGLQGANFAANTILGFIAGLSASAVFFILCFRAKREFKIWLSLAGIFFFCYALAKLPTSQPPGFLSGTLLNQDLFFSYFGFPIQLARCALALLSSFTLWLYWYSSRAWVEVDLSAPKKQAYIFRAVFLFTGFITLSWFITEGVGRYYKESTSRELITKANTGAAAVNPRRVSTLSATSADLENPDYMRLKEQIEKIKGVNNDLRFVYLLRLQDDKIVILADSDLPGSPDYSSPGEVYRDAPAGLKENFFKRESFILGPYTDKWGTWVSAYSPVMDWEAKNVISRVGMDISVAVFQNALFHHRLIGIITALGLFILLISIFMIVELNKLAVNKVVYAQRRLQALIDNIPNPIYYKNKEGVYLGCNLAMEQFLGLNKGQIIGRTVFDIFPDREAARKYHEIERELFEHPGIRAHEDKLRNIDGSDYDVIFNRATYPGPDGKVAGLVGVIIDISERKKAENVLRRLAAIVESSDDAIIGKDMDGVITSWNYGAQKIYGYSAEEALGRSINLIVPPEKKNETAFIFDKIKNGEHLKHYETLRITKDGGILNMSLTISPIKDNSGEIIGASTIGRDITERKMMEGELKRRKELLEAQNEASLDGLLVVDENGKRILTNKRLIDLWRVPQHIIDDKNDEALLRYVVSRVKNPEQFLDKVNYLYAHKDETSKDEIEFKEGIVFERYSSPVIDKDGKYFGRIWTFRDITERVKAQEELKNNEEKFRAIYEGSYDAHMLLNEKGFLDCNRRTLVMFGFESVDEFRKIHPSNISPPFQPDGRDSRSASMQYIQAAFESGYSSFEWVHRRKDGRDFPAEVLLSRVHLTDGDYLQAIVRDITRRKKDEEKIALAVEEWERTFNAISDLVFIQDKDFNIIKVNKACCAALKLKPEEILGRKCYEILHNLDHPWPGCPAAKTQADHTPHSEEVDDPHIGMPLLVTVSPIMNAKGEFVGSVHVAQDISERKRVESALREVINMKTDFTSTVSHELRTPLAAIKEGISIVLDGTSGAVNKEQKEFLDIAKKNVDRLTRIINDILDFQKLESGKMAFNMSPNDINEVAAEAGKTMRAIIEQKGLKLSLELGKQIPNIQFDRDRVTQVFTNLINNAVKFTEKGSITIQTALEGSLVKVSVKDTGVGIRKEELPLLFERFKQLDSGMARKTGGTGLGLSICKDIVEKHNGKVWVESKFGEGSVFGFSLPAI